MTTLRLLLIYFSITLVSCTSFKELDVKDVSDIKVSKLNGDGAEIQATILIENPNGYKIKVTSIKADILLNQKPAGTLSLSKKVILRRKTSTTYSFVFDTRFSNLASHIPSILMGKGLMLSLNGSLRGKVGLLSKKYPITLEKKISPSDLNLF